MDASQKCLYVFHTTVLDGRGWMVRALSVQHGWLSQLYVHKNIPCVTRVCPHPTTFSSQRVKVFSMTQSRDHRVLTLHLKLDPHRLTNNNNTPVSFEIFMAMWLTIPVFWDMMLHHWVSGVQHFGGELLSSLSTVSLQPILAVCPGPPNLWKWWQYASSKHQELLTQSAASNPTRPVPSMLQLFLPCSAYRCFMMHKIINTWTHY